MCYDLRRDMLALGNCRTARVALDAMRTFRYSPNGKRLGAHSRVRRRTACRSRSTNSR